VERGQEVRLVFVERGLGGEVSVSKKIKKIACFLCQSPFYDIVFLDNVAYFSQEKIS